MTRALALMGVEAVAFFLATLNLRYCSKGYVGRTLLTDVLIAANGFVVIKLVAEAQTAVEMCCYAIGAGIGSLTAMRLTRGLNDR